MTAQTTSEAALRTQWQALRERLCAKQLLTPASSSLSLRIPGAQAMFFGDIEDAKPQRLSLEKTRTLKGAAGMHAAVYAARADVGGMAHGGGAFGVQLGDHGGVLPQVFDEQARHLGPMAKPLSECANIAAHLAGGGNVQLLGGIPLCLGTTSTRLALNAELFEKCAKAYVLAVATGGEVKELPWIVRFVANRRMRKDEKNAALRFAQGLLPVESRGY